jgi:hypothetical protein
MKQLNERGRINKPGLMKALSEFYLDSSSHGKLSKEETTQILETQKLVNQEVDVFGKIIELVKEVKGK